MIENESRSKFIGLIWLTLTCLMAILLALGIPRLGGLIPWSVENHLARALQTAPTVSCQGKRWPKSLLAFEKLKTRLFPFYPNDKTLPVAIEIIPGQTVNAFAVLGGHIYVYEGLLKEAQSPEELAGVLAHEIEHVARRHIMQGALVRILTLESLRLIFSSAGGDPSLYGFLLNMKFNREQEQDADEGGLKRLRDTQVSAQGFEDFFQRMQNNSSLNLTILSDHPGSESRTELASRFKGGSTRPVLSHDEWNNLKRICN